ncbi:MAG: CDP-diacylglycerol--glycerol-3-phosphate 3-phosphatidyltransferase [Ruminiclostridium sp.]|nr:CDP-diacylglycerol--glycerol-3-phosphate 3-phosphatidyltransferase [Ruminiclostridium sp.]
MNLANKLTMFRVILVPFFIAALMIPMIPCRFTVALVIFALASITDMLDGKVARKYNMITDLGKFLDPLADKVLVAAALICFIELGYAPSWAVWLIIAREFMVSGIRLIAAGSEKKLVIAANIWGKLKTASTMVAICVILVLHILADDFAVIGGTFPTQLITDILLYVCTFLTVLSGIIYLYDYREVLKESKS